MGNELNGQSSPQFGCSAPLNGCSTSHYSEFQKPFPDKKFNPSFAPKSNSQNFPLSIKQSHHSSLEPTHSKALARLKHNRFLKKNGPQSRLFQEQKEGDRDFQKDQNNKSLPALRGKVGTPNISYVSGASMMPFSPTRMLLSEKGRSNSADPTCVSSPQQTMQMMRIKLRQLEDRLKDAELKESYSQHQNHKMQQEREKFSIVVAEKEQNYTITKAKLNELEQQISVSKHNLIEKQQRLNEALQRLIMVEDQLTDAENKMTETQNRIIEAQKRFQIESQKRKYAQNKVQQNNQQLIRINALLQSNKELITKLQQKVKEQNKVITKSKFIQVQTMEQKCLSCLRLQQRKKSKEMKQSQKLIAQQGIDIKKELLSKGKMIEQKQIQLNNKLQQKQQQTSKLSTKIRQMRENHEQIIKKYQQLQKDYKSYQEQYKELKISYNKVYKILFSLSNVALHNDERKKKQIACKNNKIKQRKLLQSQIKKLKIDNSTLKNQLWINKNRDLDALVRPKSARHSQNYSQQSQRAAHNASIILLQKMKQKFYSFIDGLQRNSETKKNQQNLKFPTYNKSKTPQKAQQEEKKRLGSKYSLSEVYNQRVEERANKNKIQALESILQINLSINKQLKKKIHSIILNGVTNPIIQAEYNQFTQKITTLEGQNNQLKQLLKQNQEKTKVRLLIQITYNDIEFNINNLEVNFNNHIISKIRSILRYGKQLCKKLS